MTRILKRGQKTYFKEDVVTCLADETMQKIFTQSEYGNFGIIVKANCLNYFYLERID